MVSLNSLTDAIRKLTANVAHLNGYGLDQHTSEANRAVKRPRTETIRQTRQVVNGLTEDPIAGQLQTRNASHSRNVVRNYRNPVLSHATEPQRSIDGQELEFGLNPTPELPYFHLDEDHEPSVDRLYEAHPAFVEELRTTSPRPEDMRQQTEAPLSISADLPEPASSVLFSPILQSYSAHPDAYSSPGFTTFPYIEQEVHGRDPASTQRQQPVIQHGQRGRHVFPRGGPPRYATSCGSKRNRSSNGSRTSTWQSPGKPPSVPAPVKLAYIVIESRSPLRMKDWQPEGGLFTEQTFEQVVQSAFGPWPPDEPLPQLVLELHFPSGKVFRWEMKDASESVFCVGKTLLSREIQRELSRADNKVLLVDMLIEIMSEGGDGGIEITDDELPVW